METKNKLHDYITTAYGRWIDYASHYIRRSKLPINPIELVDEVLCILLERDSERMNQMINHPSKIGTELDLFILHIIKTNIYSPRSPFRYKRERRCMNEFQDDTQDVDQATDVDRDNIQSLVELAVSKIDDSKLSKKIFIWKYFDGNPISKWPGPETKRVLYRAYARIFKKIITEIRGKITC